jgi:hypothetical protein
MVICIFFAMLTYSTSILLISVETCKVIESRHVFREKYMHPTYVTYVRTVFLALIFPHVTIKIGAKVSVVVVNKIAVIATV